MTYKEALENVLINAMIMFESMRAERAVDPKI